MKVRTLAAYLIAAVKYARDNPSMAPYTVACLVSSRKPEEVLREANL